MDGCVYRTKDGECDLYAEGGKFKAFCDPEHCDNIAPTNADRIRAMTDAELANFLNDIGECDRRCPAKIGDCIFSDSSCVAAWLDWLKQEAKE